MNKELTLGLMMSLASGWGNPVGSRKKYQKKKVKQCLNCGNEHTHNNRFCSAECCKEFK